MPKLIQLEQGSPEWHAYRKKGIGASDTAIIQEISPWTSPLMLYEEKMAQTPPSSQNFAMSQGHKYEPIVRAHINKIQLTIYEPAVYESDIHPWAYASLDGWDLRSRKGIEIKCNNAETHAMAREKKIPPYYMCQMQKQMFVMNAEVWLYISYHVATNNYLFVEVLRDEIQIAKIIKDERKFYFENMLGFIPPDPIDMDFIKVNEPEYYLLAGEYETLREGIKNREDRLKVIRQHMIDRAAGRRIKIGNLKVAMQIRKGSLDQDKMLADGIDVDKYRSSKIETWCVR